MIITQGFGQYDLLLILIIKKTHNEDYILDARLFTQAPVLPGCIDEVALSILHYLRAQELLTLRLVSKDFTRLAIDHHLWRKLYERDFGPLVTTDEARFQYFAAHLYQRANSETRLDLAQIRFICLQTFLTPHAQKPWAKYYLGEMYIHGKGTVTNEKEGYILLLESANLGDYKAINTLINVLECYSQGTAHHSDLLDDISKEKFAKFMSILKRFYNQGVTNMHGLLHTCINWVLA